MQELEGRTAVVTGAARGIGFAIVTLLASRGANIVIADLDGAAAAEAASSLDIGDRAIGVACDVSTEADVARLVAQTTDTYAALDIFVNNAGITRDATMRKMTLDEFELVVDVHLKGTWLGTREAANAMRALGSTRIDHQHLVDLGKVGLVGQTNYSAAKAGIVGLTKAAAKEVGFAGVRVNAVQPGLIRTPMTDSMREDIKSARIAEIPLGRMGEAAEVAEVVAFLASDRASYISGAVLEVTGGRFM